MDLELIGIYGAFALNGLAAATMIGVAVFAWISEHGARF